jgi:hypothetical protein
MPYTEPCSIKITDYTKTWMCISPGAMSIGSHFSYKYCVLNHPLGQHIPFKTPIPGNTRAVAPMLMMALTSDDHYFYCRIRCLYLIGTNSEALFLYSWLLFSIKLKTSNLFICSRMKQIQGPFDYFWSLSVSMHRVPPLVESVFS